jgi:hypothetical protein
MIVTFAPLVTRLPQKEASSLSNAVRREQSSSIENSASKGVLNIDKDNHWVRGARPGMKSGVGRSRVVSEKVLHEKSCANEEMQAKPRE